MVGLVAMKKKAEIKWKSREGGYYLLSNRLKTAINGTGIDVKIFRNDVIETGDIITIELNLSERKVKFSFKDKEYESIISENVSFDGLIYYLVCRVGKGLGHQMSIIDYSSVEFTDE